MALSLGRVEAKVLVQIGDREPVVVGTMSIPLRYAVEVSGSAEFEPGSD
jgi:hypothetical protein